MEERYDRAAFAVQVAILAMVAHRLAAAGDESETDIQAGISEDTGKADAWLRALAAGAVAWFAGDLRKTAEGADRAAKPFYEFRGMEPVRSAKDPAMFQMMKRIERKETVDVANICRTTVMMIQDSAGNWARFDDAYRSMMWAALRDVPANGIDGAVSKMVNRLAANGMRIQYASGCRREFYSAFRMNIRDAFFNAHEELNAAHGARFGADGVEISAHGLCAADHLPYQGKRFKTERFNEIQASLERPIARGYNCRHHTDPVIMGAGARAYSADDLRRIRAESERMTGFRNAQGRELNAYEFTQWQRNQESRVRKLNGQISVKSAAGLPVDDLRETVQAVKAGYYAASRKAGVQAMPERFKTYVFKP